MIRSLRDIAQIALIITVSVAARSAVAQTTDTQTFTVTVPSSLSITAPADESLTHDATNNNQVFTPGATPADHWQVLCNSANGASVSLKTLSAFTHTVDGSYERDAQLDLTISYTDVDGGGTAIWTPGITSDVTDYASGDGEAEVTASSSVPGRASLAVTVTFITDTYSTLLEGDYVTTVEGTISAN